MFDFINKFIKTTKPLQSYQDFLNIVKNEYDVYLVGSDQVWRARVFKYIDYAFLDFVKNDKPIFLSYAASFGVDTWEFTQEETVRFQEQIQKFSAVSVREDTGVDLCKKYFHKKAVHVLDPTMLLDVKDYTRLISTANELKHNGDLLTYILDEADEKLNLIKLMSEKLGMKTFKINPKSRKSKVLEDMVYPTITSWLKGFEQAKYVITDSFHGCVFAIIFNKPFLVYGNRERGMARFNSLLKIFGLEDRLILNVKDVEVNMVKSIDWEKVNKILEDQKKVSISYLKDTLNMNLELKREKE
jgi:hypothetical protein